MIQNVNTRSIEGGWLLQHCTAILLPKARFTNAETQSIQFCGSPDKYVYELPTCRFLQAGCLSHHSADDVKAMKEE